MSPLLEAQLAFFKCVPRLIDFAVGAGYFPAAGELWRSPQQAQWNAQHGTGIANSLHTQRLAIDIVLFGADGSYYDGSKPEHLAAYRDLGRYWTGLDPHCCWGGDFSRPDPDHFSYTFGGVK